MLLATIVLLFPFPQSGMMSKAVDDLPAVASDSATKDANAPAALPAAPAAKVKTDAEISAEPVPAGFPIEPVKPVTKRPSETSRQRKMWYGLLIADHAGAAFDAYSTRRAISGGFGTESNPFLRPFSHSNAIYAATQVVPLVADYFGKRMMVSEHPLLRRIWWLPQSASAVVSFSAGAHNTALTQ